MIGRPDVARSQLGRLSPEEAIKALSVADGLQVRTFAADPDIVSISNIDVDHRGRVWACEAVNYRGNNGKRPKGDRILILEDTDGDGRADKTTVFYQGRDIDIAMGLCVLGSKAIVSVAPEILLLEDTDGDDRADKKTVLFTSDAEYQHDHSLHSFVFGPDGRFYGNFGNTGRRLIDPAGRTMLDGFGHAVAGGGKPYHGGIVFRCDRDWTHFEVLGHNFRNNYEATVDSFGNVWQSDNDDDGNFSVRFNYVLEGGNYGYLDEFTGERWRAYRIGAHEERAMRHWHQNDPGVVPNVLVTGSGAPTCITVYEGRLLPPVFQDQVIHCDAGPHVVRAYPVEPRDAGFAARIVNLLTTSDPNFRPVDVAVAPDGSLLVSDWYDPVVGGFQQDDIERGRIYWIAPPGHEYAPPAHEFDTPAGAVRALRNPNFCTRALAWLALYEMGPRAEGALVELLGDDNPRMRARALWLLARIPGREDAYLRRAREDRDPNVRIVSVRLAHLLDRSLADTIEALSDDPSPRVRAECAVNLRFVASPERASLWARLAAHHDPGDRWYLEALGIGARSDWDACLSAWLDAVGDDWDSDAGRDIIWRSRARATPQRLAQIIATAKPREDVRRYVRAFDFQSGPQVQDALSWLAFGQPGVTSPRRPNEIDLAVMARLDADRVRSQPNGRQRLLILLADAEVTPTFVTLVTRHDLHELHPKLLQSAQQKANHDLGILTVRALLDFGRTGMLRNALSSDDSAVAANTLQALAESYHEASIDLVLPALMDSTFDAERRRHAARSLCRFPRAAHRLIDLLEQDALPPEIEQAVAGPLLTAWRDEVRLRAESVLPPSPSKGNQPLPPLRDLARMRGDAANGRNVFRNQGKCSTCHTVGGEGKMVGPDLSQIGEKLDRSALFDSILFPSAGINHDYDTFTLVLASGQVAVGILVNQSETEVSIRTQDARTRTFPRSEIDEIRRQTVSLMPADLHKLMTAQELVDVVEYLTTLRSRPLE